MPEHARRFTIDVQEERVVTSFVPPVPENMTFEALTSVLPIEEILHEDGATGVTGVVYKKTYSGLLSEKLEQMQEELAANTGYKLKGGIRKLLAQAVQ